MEPVLLWLTLAAVVIAQLGAHLDAAYHVRAGFALESFWTWPHAVLYGGKAATAVVAAIALRSGTRATAGYGLVLAGVGLFLIGGGIDVVWHRWVGIEVGLEALLSPAHLGLVVASAVSGAGLLRVALAHRAAAPPGWRADAPVVAGLAVLFRITTWSLFYSAPAAADYAAGGARVGSWPAFAGMAWDTPAAAVAGVTGFVLHAVLLAGFLVGPVRACGLPRGAVAAIIGWDAGLTAAVSGYWLAALAAVAPAVAGEALAARIRQSGGRDGRAGYRALAGLVPAVGAATSLVLLAPELRWSPALTAGTPVLAGLYGLATSLLMLPPGRVGDNGGDR
jgi:hypothetical protein